ncbi:MAG: hypothetical protein H8E37_12160, partial [Planctomycetes bacterium]|nr:hypothetical protein [Planctomycetota bacterium]
MAERDHARNTFEEIVRSMKDPALLEWVDGSTFKMRVFPLEPRQEKRIVMSYTQRLSNDYGKETYRFPAGHNLDRVRDWSTQVKVAGGANLEWDSQSHFLKAKKSDGDLVLEGEAQKVTMKDDLVVELTDPAQKRVRSSTRFSSAEHEGQQYLMLRMRPDLGKGRSLQRKIRNYVFLFESSGDRDPVLARVQVDLIRTFLENAEHEDTFSIVRASSKAERFSVRPVPCVKKQITKAIDFMEDSHLLGALDLEAAFKMCGKLKSDNSENWLVHVGSGIPAIGERDATALQRLLPKKTRYVGVGIGKRWNRPFMKTAAGRTGGHFAQINPDEKIGWRAFELFSTLNAPRLLDVKVVAVSENKDDDDPQCKFLNFADTIAHGQELCAVTRIAGDDALPKSLVVTGLLNGKPFQQTVKVKKVAKNADYLPRSWSRLEIDRLVALGANEHKDTIISLSKAMYVMSPFTSLLVLENEEMYKQYNIDRGRKDHWALYGAPPQIKVVHEPVMGPRPNTSPVEIRELLKRARAEHDVTQADLSLAERDERSEKIIGGLEDQLQRRVAHVDSLSRQLKQHESKEKDTLQKLAQTVVGKRPQVAGQPLWYGDSVRRYTTLARPSWTTEELRSQRQLMLLNRLNNGGRATNQELETRIAQYELAYRMQPGFVLSGEDINLNGLADDLLTIVPQTDGRIREINRQWGIAVRNFGIEPAFNQLPTPSLSQLSSREAVDLKYVYIPQSTLSGEPLQGIYFRRVLGRPVRGTIGNGLDFDVDSDIDGDGWWDEYGFRNRPNLAPRDGTTSYFLSDIEYRNAHTNLTRLRENEILGGIRPRYRTSVEDYNRRLSSFHRQSGRQEVRLTRELAESVPELLNGIRGDVSIEALDELGALIIRGNSPDVDSVMAVIQQLEQPTTVLDSSVVRVIPLQVRDQRTALNELLIGFDEAKVNWQIDESQLHVGSGLVDLSRRRLGGQIFERGAGRININTLRNPQ